MEHPNSGAHDGRQASGGMYRRLFIMVLVSFVAMYALMYAMVNAFDNVVNNVNQGYMAMLMASAMVIIELVVMWRMYGNRRLNFLIVAASAAALLLSWFGIRQQVGVGNRQFLRSMIPHHSGAILMCREAVIDDPRIQQLCKGIVESQQAEITQMKQMLRDAK